MNIDELKVELFKKLLYSDNPTRTEVEIVGALYYDREVKKWFESLSSSKPTLPHGFIIIEIPKEDFSKIFKEMTKDV